VQQQITLSFPVLDDHIDKMYINAIDYLSLKNKVCFPQYIIDYLS